MRYVSASPAHLEVRVVYRLRNVGNAPLPLLEVALPDPERYGRRNLRITVDNQDVAPSSSAASTRVVEIPLDPALPRQHVRTLAIAYELAPPVGHPDMGLRENAFHLRPYGWFPRLERPNALFARGDPPPKVHVTLHVPADFRVLANGHTRGARRRPGETSMDFELGEGDGAPFVVAGRYLESRFEAPGADVIFWTFQPVAADAGAQAAARVAASFRALEEAFGPLEPRPRAVWVVETAAWLHPRATDPDGPAGISFPMGTLLNVEAFALGPASAAFLNRVEHELAHGWFGQALVARPYAEMVLTEALAEYATFVAAEARQGAGARRRHAADLLRQYDVARLQAVEKPLEALRPDDPWEQRVFAYHKGTLFFLALEDECGRAVLHRGLARMVRALRGGQAGLQDLRAALEAETGRGLGAFFRVWLYQAGVPEAFRSRYEGSAEPEG